MPARHFSMRRVVLGLIAVALAGCAVPKMPEALAPVPVSERFDVNTPVRGGTDSASATANVPWHTFFADTALVALIDTAIHNNPDRLSALQDIEIARQQVQAIRGQLSPQVGIASGVGISRPGRFTADGAGNATTDMTPGNLVPQPLPDFSVGFTASWEADVRGKIRSQKGAALNRFLASIEGARYVTTGLVADVANSYYELAALDAKLAIVRQAIQLQQSALRVVQAQRDAAQVTELAVQQFRALVLDAQALEYDLQQQIRETENQLNLLLGRFPQPVARGALQLPGTLRAVAEGIPAQLLQNRPDIAQAEFLLKASRFDVRAARAEFFPELDLSAALGVDAFKPRLLVSTAKSISFGLAANAVTPFINRRTIHAQFAIATAAQRQALQNYRQTIVSGVNEVNTLMTAIANLERQYTFKSQQADALDRSTVVANELFSAARATYLEVLTAQREALDVKLEVVDTRLAQRQALTNLYRALGGGWK